LPRKSRDKKKKGERRKKPLEKPLKKLPRPESKQRLRERPKQRLLPRRRLKKPRRIPKSLMEFQAMLVTMLKSRLIYWMNLTENLSSSPSLGLLLSGRRTPTSITRFPSLPNLMLMMKMILRRCLRRISITAGSPNSTVNNQT